MKLLHRMLLRALPAPFFGAVGTLVFLLVLQFLIRYARELLGKGLPARVIVELVAYNMAYIVTLAVPMAVFVAVIVAFARMSESQAYAALQAAGVSLRQFAAPVLLWALAVGLGLAYFANVVLPEANLRARTLWSDIRRTQPGFALEPGVFFTRLPGYAVLAQRIPTPSRLEDLLVVDQTKGEERRVVLRARRGRLVAEPGDRMVFLLDEGQLVRSAAPGGPDSLGAPQDRTEVLAFDRLRLALDVSGLGFRRDTAAAAYRTDRTTPTREMVRLVDSVGLVLDSLRTRRDALADRLLDTAAAFEPPPPLLPDSAALPPAAAGPPRPGDPLAGLDPVRAEAARQAAQQALGQRRSEGALLTSQIDAETARTNRYRVEIHKKQSFAVACVTFTLAGALLGLGVSRRRGGIARVGLVAVLVFLFFWVTLVMGEKMTDRGLGPPWLGQWMANLVIGAVALAAFFDVRAPAPLRRLWTRAADALGAAWDTLRARLRRRPRATG